MSSRCFSRVPLVLDASDDKEEAPREATLAALSEEIMSDLGGLTILSSWDDASWVDARAPCPQSAPAHAGVGRLALWSNFSGSVLVRPPLLLRLRLFGP